ncbi:MAG TPA: RagB/SusD family nutrient uptake outer membrane protein [Ohtaekwangia sp.]|uniref:RagB/SusD family nutrient uptake outer membrane protein n=1 Tax=Ohtaekwangia sp. TaxID=2066019 RepID=UPI002F92D662
MKKYIKYIAFAAALQPLSSCSDFLEPKPKGLDLESNYYLNQQQAFNGLIAVYDVVGWQGGNLTTKVGAMCAASDDHLGGGEGTGDKTFTSLSDYVLTPAIGPQEDLWKKGYSGIFRANTLLQKLPGVPMDESLKLRYTAETLVLRAYFNFDLVRLFKNIPLLNETVSPDEMYNITQAAPEDVYKQIEEDLLAAIAEPNLPNTVPAATEGGRITKGIAHALLGKVYMYEKKYAEAAAELKEVNGTPGQLNATYGYKLIDNFGDLWKSTADVKFNSESIFEVGYTSTSAGGWSCIACTEGNILNIMTGPRGYTTKTANAPDYISGWSYFPVTKSLFDAIHYDPRYKYTIANLDSLKQYGIADYTPGAQNTGWFLEKFAGRKSNTPVGAAGAPELNYPQNMYEIRLADTYLLEAEALVQTGTDQARADALLNAVRARVGLGPITATLLNIKNERRLELAGEGHRWFDLVRWGDAAAALADRGFVAGKHEILPIPLNELNNTKLEQSKEWGGTK